MINIVVKRKSNHIHSIEVKGHAGSGPYGFDLVCAGVSAILTGGANALQGEGEEYFNITFKSGYAFIEHKDGAIYNDKFTYTLETMFVLLKTMEESYSEFIRISEKDI